MALPRNLGCRSPSDGSARLSERQAEVAATDGEKAFTAAFGGQADDAAARGEPVKQAGETFTAVIFESDRPRFGAPETTMQGKRICVTG